mmetsp:Transcript_4690/g.7278  ORF Transcript_4690/g.7278 Transcript_4690/m.7278 type:complete len:203 (-) Transcript_4690:218-826(-)
MFEKLIVVDGRGHLLGRLASIIAKEILNGQHVVVVRTEEMNISGSFFRNKLKFHEFLRKRMNTNPGRGPFHFRSPAKMLFRTVRGMLPHKTKRGQAAMERLKVFEGVPPPYDKMKRMVVPSALRILRLRPGRKYTVLGRLASEVGWHYKDLVTRLEANRKTKSAAYYAKKKALIKLRTKAAANVAPKHVDVKNELEAYGYAF